NVASIALRIFDQQCKKTFATKSAITGPEQSQQISPLFDHLIGYGEQSGWNIESKGLAMRRLGQRQQIPVGILQPSHLGTRWRCPNAKRIMLQKRIPLKYHAFGY